MPGARLRDRGSVRRSWPPARLLRQQAGPAPGRTHLCAQLVARLRLRRDGDRLSFHADRKALKSAAAPGRKASALDRVDQTCEKPLVPRTRSSHAIAASSIANFGFKAALEL